jgi:hypothetical protein
LSWRGELGFEVGDALVVEPEVLPCGLELLLRKVNMPQAACSSSFRK